MIRNLKMLKKISFMLLSLILVGLTLAGSKYFTDMGTQSWYPAANRRRSRRRPMCFRSPGHLFMPRC